MHGKHILLGVTGGIAAYKSADLVRRLRERGAEVQVVMTDGAREFVTPMTFQALSGRPVRTDLWDPGRRGLDGAYRTGPVGRSGADRAGGPPIFWPGWPAERADDLLATTCLATAAPIALAPAMNQQMWANPATQANVALPQRPRAPCFWSGIGDQACGEVGAGRMLEPTELAALADSTLVPTGVLSGRRVLITAGPTREPIDPVRFISNRSSGKMGFAVAQAAREGGRRGRDDLWPGGPDHSGGHPAH